VKAGRKTIHLFWISKKISPLVLKILCRKPFFHYICNPYKKAMANQVKIFSGSSSRYLAEKIAAKYGQELGKVAIYRFSDGEFQPSFEETVRGSDVFIIQSTFPPTENLFELLLMIDAAKRASANQIVAVMPYFGYARQDRKDKPRVAIGAKLVANLLSAAGATRIVTMDLHADQIQGFFDFPVDHLYASSIFLPYIQSLNLPNLTMAAPDMGGTKRANAYAKYLKSEIVICYKQRTRANVVDSMTLIGEVEGRDIMLVDDLIDTGGTLTKAADLMLERGAKSVRAVCTHAVLSGKAYENIEKSGLTELIVTNTIPLAQESKKIRVLSVEDLFAKVLHSVNSHESISSHFIVS
jgi:ribose-phosphate pyrophosphokinase